MAKAASGRSRSPPRGSGRNHRSPLVVARRGLLDTNTVILLPRLRDRGVLPEGALISAITLAELSVGPLVATNDGDRAARQAELQTAEATFDPLPFDAAAARAF